MIIGIDISSIPYGTGVSEYTKQLVLNLLKIDSKNQYKLFLGSLRLGLSSEFNSELKKHKNCTLFTFPLPTPNDSRVKLVTIPEKKMAVMTFSWYQTDARVMSKKQELLDVLKKEGVTMVGSPQYAGYNAPWTPPWMTRNEVMVEIK
jgi:hypothetical protein